MPFHLVLDMKGSIQHVGPTLGKLLVDCDATANLFSIFDIRRPLGATCVPELLAAESGHVALAFRHASKEQFKGVAVAVSDGVVLINMSFGISVIDAVQRYDLTASDFARTDLAVEMLYLIEAKSAALAESKNLNARLQSAKIMAEEQASTDTLTGLKNRRAMEQVLSNLAGRGVPFSLMHLDLDHFKQVNDTFGHSAGDDVLRSVAEILVAETRSADTVVRAGGDEFVLIFPSLASGETLRDLGSRIIARLEDVTSFGAVATALSASIGAAISHAGESIGVDEILGYADAALYASKRGGRGRLTIHGDDLSKKDQPAADRSTSRGV